jgi:Membrane domain of glycerophosphoryl diester phosphodiesterase
MDVMAVFSGTWSIVKQKFGLLLGMTLAATGVVTVALVLFGLAIAGSIVSMIAGVAPSAAAIVGMVVGYLAVVVVSYLAVFKAQAMITLGAYEVAQGRTPTFSGLLAGTKGFLPRLTVLFALGLAAVILISVLMGLLFAGMAESARSSGSSAAGLGLVGVIMVTMIIVIVGGYYLTVKLLYVVPLIAIDQLDGISALKRSWKLTDGAFWRTLGYVLLLAIVLGVGSTIISFIAQIFMIPAVGSLSALEYTNDPAAVFAALLATAPFLIIPTLLTTAYQIVATPFMCVYVAVMYIDQVRRSELPPGYVPPTAASYNPPGFPPVNPDGYPPPPPPPPAQPH